MNHFHSPRGILERSCAENAPGASGCAARIMLAAVGLAARHCHRSFTLADFWFSLPHQGQMGPNHRRALALLAALKRIGIGLLFSAGACLGQGANPDHLEPISPYDAIGYGQTVYNALVGKHPAKLWMMCMPSIHPEWAVILRAETETSRAEPSPGLKLDTLPNPDEKQKWVLEIAVAAQPVSELHKNGKVERKKMEVDDATAKTLEEAWTAVTQQTRYTAGNVGGFDGVTYQFYSNGEFGETWSPPTGLPAALVELAGRLRKCVESPAEGRNPLLEEAMGKARDIKSQAANATGKSKGGGGVPQ
jgi:hypothetical protein